MEVALDIVRALDLNDMARVAEYTDTDWNRLTLCISTGSGASFLMTVIHEY